MQASCIYHLHCPVSRIGRDPFSTLLQVSSLGLENIVWSFCIQAETYSIINIFVTDPHAECSSTGNKLLNMHFGAGK